MSEPTDRPTARLPRAAAALRDLVASAEPLQVFGIEVRHIDHASAPAAFSVTRARASQMAAAELRIAAWAREHLPASAEYVVVCGPWRPQHQADGITLHERRLYLFSIDLPA